MFDLQARGLQEQSAAHLEDEDEQVAARDEQPGPSGAAPARAASAGQNAEDRAKKQSKRASADDKVGQDNCADCSRKRKLWISEAKEKRKLWMKVS